MDDSRFQRKRLKEAIEATTDCDIIEAANGEEALELWQTHRTPVVFLDLNMPIVDGYEVLRQLNMEADMPKVFIVSADIQPLAKSRVAAMGAEAFVEKPFVPNKIRALLTAYEAA